MANITLRAKLLLKHNTKENWETLNPILLPFEMGIEEGEDGNHKFKFGDGITAWNQLPYTFDLSTIFDKIEVSIGTDQIKDLAVTEAKIADSSITTDKILDGAITEEKLGNGSVTEEKIEDSAVTSAKIANESVTEEKISQDAVSTEKIKDAAVTEEKILDGVVTGQKIAKDAVTEEKIADSAVTSVKLASGAVTQTKILDKAIKQNHISDQAVGTDQIKDSAVTEEKIADNTTFRLKFVHPQSVIEPYDNANTFPINEVTTIMSGSNIANLPIDGIAGSLYTHSLTSITGALKSQLFIGIHENKSVAYVRYQYTPNNWVAWKSITNLSDGEVKNDNIADNVTFVYRGASIQTNDADDAPAGSVYSIYLEEWNNLPPISSSGLKLLLTAPSRNFDRYQICIISPTLLDDSATRIFVRFKTASWSNWTDIAKLADGAVTSAKLADGAVTSAKLADGAVTSAKLADGFTLRGKYADVNMDAPYDNADTFPSNEILSCNRLVATNMPYTGNFSGTFITVCFFNSAILVSQLALDRYNRIFYRFKYANTFTDWVELSNTSYDYSNDSVGKVSMFTPAIFEKIAVIGDSFSCGLIRGKEVEYFRWGAIMCRMLGNTYVHYGKSGANLETCITNTLPTILEDDPSNLYIINLGINNETTSLGTIDDVSTTDPSTNPNTSYGNLGKIILSIKQHAPDSRIIVVYRTTGGAVEGSDLLTLYSSVSEKLNVAFIVPQNTDYYFKGGSTAPFNTYYDIGHPTAVGYGAYALAFIRMISKCMNDNVDYFKFYSVYSQE